MSSSSPARRVKARAALLLVTTGAYAFLPLAATPARAEDPAAPAGPAATPNQAVEEIVVRAHAYKPPTPIPSAKIDANLHDLPITIDQVTAPLLSDRAVVSTDEALDTVAGVRLIPGYPGASGFLVRGFFETYNVLVDGFRDSQALQDPQAVERIDVLKGPPSVLFGAQSPGGIANFVSKVPQARDFASFEALGGSYGEKRVTGDANRVYLDDQVEVRLNLAYDDADNFRNFVKSEGRLAAPALIWKITPDDTLTLRASYTQYDYDYYTDLPPVPQFLHIPIKESLGEPDLPQSRSHEGRLSYEYSHDFGGGWRLRSALGFNRYEVDHGLSRVYYPTLEADGQTLDRTLEEGPQSNTAVTLQEEVYGKFNTGPIQHNLVAGFEYYDEYYSYVDNFANIAPLNILHPMYGARPGPVYFGYAGETGDDNEAFYLQDLISLTRQWKFFACLRFDHNDSFYLSRDASGAETSRVAQINNAATPRLGLIYQPVRDTSFYVSWSRSFFPQVYDTTFNNTILPPDRGEQVELGVKQDLLNQRLSLTAALYHLTRDGVGTTDPAHPAFYIASGQQRSQGVELSAVGTILAGWNTTFSYAYTDAVVTRDNVLPVGNELAGVPRNAISLFTQYEIPAGRLAGLGGGVGVNYASARQALLPNTFRLPGYARVDALAYYRFATHYRIGINIKNLGNVRYYDTDGGYVLRPGAPLTALASLRADF